MLYTSRKNIDYSILSTKISTCMYMYVHVCTCMYVNVCVCTCMYTVLCSGDLLCDNVQYFKYGREV